MSIKLGYTIRFVANMNQAVAFYRDVLGLPLRFQSPDWSEFATGETTLALHTSSPLNPPGKVQLGFHVSNLQQFYEEMSARGIQFTQLPTREGGSLLARFIDSEGTECSISQSG
jgi:lactoylglutathione lyase